MIRLILSFLLLLASLSTLAATQSYRCRYHGDIEFQFDVKFDQCALTPQATFDICQVDDSKLIIAINPTKSLLLSPSGELLEVSCREYYTPEASSSMEPPRAPQQAPTGPSGRMMEPGHGGSNIRGRGIIKPESP